MRTFWKAHEKRKSWKTDTKDVRDFIHEIEKFILETQHRQDT